MTHNPPWQSIKGFMADDEAARLHELALSAAPRGPVVEIGSYCGRSAVIIGLACKRRHSVLYSIDHHRGSEEQQKGEAYFDPDLYDETLGRVNTLPRFLQTLEQYDLAGHVVPMIGTSAVAGRCWQTPLSMVFVDGGHAFEAVDQDVRTWAPHLMPGGLLVMHDIFPDPSKGGQAPRQVYDHAIFSGGFIVRPMTRTLGVLEKRAARSSGPAVS